MGRSALQALAGCGASPAPPQRAPPGCGAAACLAPRTPSPAAPSGSNQQAKHTNIFPSAQDGNQHFFRHGSCMLFIFALERRGIIQKPSRVGFSLGFFFVFLNGMEINVSSSNAGGKARQPAQPPAHAHTPWSSTWRSWPCQPASPTPRQRGMPQLPQTPQTPFGGDADTERGTASTQSPLSCVPGQPSPSRGSAPSGVWQRRAEQGAPTLTYSHWRRQQQPLTSMFPCILAV